MSFDPDDPKLLTADKKLFNIKKKLNQLARQFHVLETDFNTPLEVVRMIHVMQIALKEIEDEVDRTV